MSKTYYFKNAHVDINFYNGNYDAYDHVKELTFVDDSVKIVVKNEDGTLFCDYYKWSIIKMIRIVQDPKEA